MPARIQLPGQLPPLSQRLARRSAVWAVFLRTLYGPARGPAIGLSPSELPALENAGFLSRSQLVARPYVLRRLLAPLFLGAERVAWTPDLEQLVFAATRDIQEGPATFDEALAVLREWGRQRFAIVREATTRAARTKALRLLDSADLLEVEPSFIRRIDGVFTVSRRARVKATIEMLKSVIDPLNWTRMGEFFDYVGPVGELQRRPSDGWSGLFEEQFEVGWGPFRISSCNPVLRVDYTFDDARLRADYALAYELDDQLECDDGYVEVRSIPGRVGWSEYYSEKSTAFRSPSTNLLSPAVMAVFMESSLSSLEDVVYAEPRDLRDGRGA